MQDQTSYAAAEPKTETSAKDWLDKIGEYEAGMARWLEQCQNLDTMYGRVDRADKADREYAIFWANIEVLRPAVYARPPAPVVAPRFKNGNKLAREASEIVERTLIVSYEQADIDGLMIEVRDDFLKYGRGTGWIRLNGNDDAIGLDHVSNDDFAHELARSWREVTWVARRSWLTKAALKRRFKDKAEYVQVQKRDPNAVIPDRGDKAPVWEIWDKTSGKVIWVSTGCDHVLDEVDAFLQLQGFFPCPRPAYGTRVSKSLRPVPEIVQYKDQIEEINEYTARIAAVSQQLRLRGFFPAGTSDITSAIEAAVVSTDNRTMLIPVSGFAALGGASFKDSIVWLPVGEAVALVQSLVELRRVVIDDVYQITGISDIVRGQSDSSETATAQQLKSQWGSIRIRDRQQELARFARDVTRISAEIVAENFPPEALLEMSQVQLPSRADQEEARYMAHLAQQAQQEVPPEAAELLEAVTVEDVVEFLRNDRTRGFVIEIETDSTIQPDENADKERRMEFVTSVGGLFQQMAPIAFQAPQVAPFMGEVLKFAAAGFRAGRPLEDAIDKLTQQLEGLAAQAQQPQEPEPDPRAQALAQKAEIDAQTGQLKLQGMEAQTRATMAKTQAEMQRIALDTQAAQAKHALTMEQMAAKAAMAQATGGTQ